MKTLALFDRKNYNPSDKKYIKNSSRAIIIKENKIAMLFSHKYKIYSFPGGTIEKNETHEEALIRETLEEAGLKIKPESIKEFGTLTEIRKDIKFENTIYWQNEFYYTCEVEENIFEPKLTKEEKEAGYQLEYVSLEKAILMNEEELKIKKMYTEAETFVLKILRDNNIGKSG